MARPPHTPIRVSWRRGPFVRSGVEACLILFAATLSNGCFYLDDDGSSNGGKVAEQQAPALGGYSSMTDLLPRQAVGQRFAVLTDRDIDVHHVEALAERFDDWAADWLGEAVDQTPEQPFPIYLCDTAETVYEIERRSGWTPSNHAGRTFEFRGGFYTPPGFIALPMGQYDDLDTIVMHELTHLALSRIIDDVPDLINEGLAELLPELFRTADEALRSSKSLTAWHHLARCERGFKGGEVQSLERLFHLGYWEFRDDKLTGLNYSLGWHLVRFLVESDHGHVAGRFPDFLRQLNIGTSGWLAFRSTYDQALVEGLWRAELERPMAWKPAFGVWEAATGGFTTRIVSPGSTVLLHEKEPSAEEPWELSFDFPGKADWPQGAVLGFAIAYRSQQDFRYFSIHREHQGAVYSHFLHGEWRDVVRQSLDKDALPAGRLSLSIERDGSLRVRLNGERLASFPASPDLHGSPSGLMLELPEYIFGQDGTEFTFRNVRLFEGGSPR